MIQTVHSFSELSDKAKEKARETFRRANYPSDDWWSDVYEDAVRMAAILGIEISTTAHRGRNGRTFQTTNIYFSGFCSQGDGASFQGTYRFNAEAVTQIRAETNDELLFSLADQLALLHTTERLLEIEMTGLDITTSGHYSHSHSINIELSDFNDNSMYEKDQYLDIFRRFADWIYKNLEAEHDYLTSDEVVDDRLAEEEFDEDGDVI